MTRFEIGTSGYIGSKKDWLNMPFINCLEINSTFYRLPNAKSIKNYNELSRSSEHKGLIYSVKVSKFITHMKRLNNCKAAFNKFWNSVKLLNNLTVLLFQMPPSFKYNEVNLERLKNITYLPTTNNLGKSINIVFEFRDQSWFRNDIVSLFKKNKWVIGGTLINKKSGTYWMGTMPSGLHLPSKTTNCTYLRIHGGRGYRGGYDKKELQKIKRSVLKQNTALNYVIFNNVFFDSRKKTCKYNKRKIRYAALCNASTFGKMTRKQRGGRQPNWKVKDHGTPHEFPRGDPEHERERNREQAMENLDKKEYMRRVAVKERERNNRILPHKVLTRAWHSVVDSLPRSRISRRLTDRHLTPIQRQAAVSIERRRMLNNKEYVPWLPRKYQTEEREGLQRSPSPTPQEPLTSGGRRTRKKKHKKRRGTRKHH